jgi:anthranilate synthase component 1
MNANLKRQRRVTLTRELPGDLDTPVGAYLKLADRPHSFLLESVLGGEQWGRYSFIGLPAREWLTIKGETITVVREGHVVEQLVSKQPMEWLRAYTGRLQVEPPPKLPNLPRFTGGYVGYFGYDCVRYFEPRLKLQAQDSLGMPDVLLMLAEEVVVFDNLRAALSLVVHADPEDAADLARAQRRLDQIEAQLNAPLNIPLRPLPLDPPAPEFSTSFAREPYLAAVARAKEYIAAGDTFQVQLGQRLSAPFRAAPSALYRAIRRLNPSPYLYCLNLGDHHVVGSSPEILVRVADAEVTLRPIAGTRPRGRTVDEDQRLEAELLADPKERAEHVMLIDLGRNDVGRVCETGVQVTERMVIERYSHVMHIVSSVTGRLRDGVGALDALRSVLPAGTLSGAPKLRAMQIIDELEPVKRGGYGGAIGWVSYTGDLDTCIHIRTVVVKDGVAHIQAGGGTVADAKPELERRESEAKAQAVLQAIELAVGQPDWP